MPSRSAPSPTCWRPRSRVHLLGVGTTYYVALFGQYLLAALADMDVPAASSDEFRHLDNDRMRTRWCWPSRSPEKPTTR